MNLLKLTSYSLSNNSQIRKYDGYNESAHKFGHISSRLENNLDMAYLSLIFAVTTNVDKFLL